MGIIFSSHPGDITAGAHFNPGYCRTLPGILKLLQIILCIIAFILAYSGYYYTEYIIGSAGWTKFATGTAFITSILIFIVYLFGMYPWIIYELIFDFLMAIFLLIAGGVMIPYSNQDGSRGACVAFCWAGMLAYFMDGILKVTLKRNATTGTGVLTQQVQHVVKV